MNHNELLLEKNNGVRIIRINRPKRKNAFSPNMYIKFAEILNNDAKDDSIVITIITGVGEYFSSGNDIIASASNNNIQEGLTKPVTKVTSNKSTYLLQQNHVEFSGTTTINKPPTRFQ
ncbi:unnamed protein product [Brassicogethes aeneus]|uniref:Uncharacterized protein n=1 Tax=Brassicogethes aeneus TaxID=1431903 RepID=A0A9P0ARY1_BRAAE|nr:unnamed protein product [Brassicogethes aeneus]